MEKFRVDDAVFVTAYQGGTTVLDVAETLGVPVEYVRQRSAALRKAGIPLKRLASLPRSGGGGRGAAPKDWSAVATLAASLLAEGDEVQTYRPRAKDDGDVDPLAG